MPVRVDVVVPGRRQVRGLLGGDLLPLGFKSVDHGGQVNRAPGDRGVGHQVQATRLFARVLGLAPADPPLVGEEQEPPPGVPPPLLSCAPLRRRSASLPRYRSTNTVLATRPYSWRARARALRRGLAWRLPISSEAVT
jgi:hypothetical protein